jgi:hypothetical protein
MGNPEGIGRDSRADVVFSDLFNIEDHLTDRQGDASKRPRSPERGRVSVPQEVISSSNSPGGF